MIDSGWQAMNKAEVKNLLGARMNWSEKRIGIELLSAERFGHSIRTPHGEIWAKENGTWFLDQKTTHKNK
jgi:hypothetical protein